MDTLRGNNPVNWNNKKELRVQLIDLINSNNIIEEDLDDGTEIFSRERLLEIQAEWDKADAEQAIKNKKAKDEELIRLEVEKFNRIKKINKEQAERDKQRNDDGRKLLRKNQEDTLAILSTTSKQAFKAFKAWKISEAIIDAIGSFNKALNSGYPPPLNFALAASSLALGFAKVSAIRSQTYSGRADGGPVSAENAYRVGERGPEMFVPGQSGYILPNQDGRTVNVNFNINEGPRVYVKNINITGNTRTIDKTFIITFNIFPFFNHKFSTIL